MKIRILFLSIMVLGIAISLHSCYYDNEEYLYSGAGCDTTLTATYTGGIESIIANNCFGGCHEQASGSAGIILEGYVNLKNEIVNGDVMCTIRWEGCSPMPKNSPKMSTCNIALIETWIANGYPEN
jgi:hypothetical protein